MVRSSVFLLPWPSSSVIQTDYVVPAPGRADPITLGTAGWLTIAQSLSRRRLVDLTPNLLIRRMRQSARPREMFRSPTALHRLCKKLESSDRRRRQQNSSKHGIEAIEPTTTAVHLSIPYNSHSVAVHPGRKLMVSISRLCSLSNASMPVC